MPKPNPASCGNFGGSSTHLPVMSELRVLEHDHKVVAALSETIRLLAEIDASIPK